MAEYAPSAIRSVFTTVDKHLSSAELSGIVGDSAHTYGYHRARNVLPSGDYSRQLSADKAGDGWAASALDIKLNATQMKLVTARLIKSAEDPDDPRMEPVREFYGTLNGSTVVGRTHNGDYNWQFETSDNSHTWHVHLSFLRKYSNDAKALQGVAAVIIGQTSVKDVNPLIGLKKGDKGEAVKGLQSMLRYAGFYLGSVDGNYGSGTASALLACRKSQGSDKANGGDAVDGWAFTQLHKALIKAEVGTISKGATGPAGPQGPAGPKGVPGPVGPAGKTPTKIAITGDVIASS